MRSADLFAVLVCALAARAEGPQPLRARTLADAGIALPASASERARETADVLDEAVLQRTLYGNLTVEQLTEEQAAEMTAAAQRIFNRQKERVEIAKKQVDAGALPRLSLTPYIEELDRARRTLQMAESRADLLRQLVEIARAEKDAFEREARPEVPAIAERYDGTGALRASDLKTIAAAYRKQFAGPLPVSARGATALHRRLGFDHRGRIDVALNPDQEEGIWLRAFLEALRIPYFAFRAGVPGRATGAHIHIGPPSERLSHGG